MSPVTYILQQHNKTGYSVLDISSLGESPFLRQRIKGPYMGDQLQWHWRTGQKFSLTKPHQQSFRQRRLLQWWGFVQLSTYPSVWTAGRLMLERGWWDQHFLLDEVAGWARESSSPSVNIFIRLEAVPTVRESEGLDGYVDSWTNYF